MVSGNTILLLARQFQGGRKRLSVGFCWKELRGATLLGLGAYGGISDANVVLDKRQKFRLAIIKER